MSVKLERLESIFLNTRTFQPQDFIYIFIFRFFYISIIAVALMGKKKEEIKG